MLTPRLPLDAMEVVDMVVIVVDTGARGPLMLKLAPTMVDTMAVITGKGLLMPMLKLAPTTVDTTAVITGKGLPMLTPRLPLDAMEVVDMVVIVVDTGARGPLMLKLAPTTVDTTAVIMGKGLPML